MTLEEKAGQLVLLPDGSESSDPTRIDQLRRGLVSGFIDPVGAMRTHHCNRSRSRKRVSAYRCFAADPAQVLPGRLPAPVGMAASWNPEAVAAAEGALAEEYLALGLNWAFSPVLATTNYLSDVGFEQSCASAWLAEQIAAGRVRGLQAQRSDFRRRVLATLDFAFNDRAGRRAEGSLREREQFRAILKTVEQAAPATIGLDTIGQGRRNVSRIANDALKNLRRAGGFDGMLLADWAQLAEKSGHHADGPAFIGLSVERLVAAVEDGRTGASELDEAVRRVLAAKFDLGLFRPSEDMAPVHRHGPLAAATRHTIWRASRSFCSATEGACFRCRPAAGICSWSAALLATVRLLPAETGATRLVSSMVSRRSASHTSSWPALPCAKVSRSSTG